MDMAAIGRGVTQPYESSASVLRSTPCDRGTPFGASRRSVSLAACDHLQRRYSVKTRGRDRSRQTRQQTHDTADRMYP